jgi:S1-C subfamily serine protease
MPTHPVRCPACQAPLELPAALLGTAVRCGGCQTLFTAPPPPAVAPPPAPAPTARRAVPAPAPAPAPPPKYRDRPRWDDDEDDRPRRKPARPKAAGGGGGGAVVLGLIAAGALALVLVGGGVAAYVLIDRSPKAPAAGPAAAPPAAAAEMAAPAAGGSKELTADVLRKVKAATVRVDVMLPNGDEGNGTGFLVHPEGLLVTNAHVVGYSRREGNRPARSVKVVFNCGEPTQRVLQAQVFGVDGDGDLAVLRVAPGGLPEALTLGTATQLRETQDLYVFGYPLGDIAGREITVSTTTVSSLRRENGVLTAVQVNGGMHPGNSGGPLTDKGGQVVGVAVAGIRGTNIHFAIPADQVDQFVRDQIAAGGKTKPATVIARPPTDPEDPPFLPPSLRRPPFGPRR